LLSIDCLIAACTVVVLATVLVGGQPPVQEPVATKLGPKAYRDGDVIEITNVTCTSPKLEQGDSLTVTGRVRLKSQQTASLCLSVTQTVGDGYDVGDGPESIHVKKGQCDFALKITIKHRGALHITMYDPKTGRPIGGTYFGTAEQKNRRVECGVLRGELSRDPDQSIGIIHGLRQFSVRAALSGSQFAAAACQAAVLPAVIG